MSMWSLGRLLVPLAIVSSSLGGSLVLAAPTDPPGVSKAIEEAQRHLDAGDSDKALETLEKAAVAFPSSPSLASKIGYARLERGEHEQAIAAYERSLAARPSQGLDLYNLAYALRKTGQLDRAAKAYTRYLEANPNDSNGWYALAETHEQREDPSAAAAAFERYAEVETRPEQAQWVKQAKEKAAKLRASADPQQPEELATNAPLNPEEDDTGEREVADVAAPTPRSGRGAAFERAVGALKGGFYREALTALSESPDALASTDYAVLAARAGAHLGLLEAKAALDLYERALTSAPEAAVPSLLFGLAEAHRVGGNPSAARETLDRALEHPQLETGLASMIRARRSGL